MINMSIPGYGELNLKYLVLDYNGTLACDGVIITGVKELLTTLSRDLEIHLLSADTFGTMQSNIAGVPCKSLSLKPESQDEAKYEYVRQLGSRYTAAIGNGRNDRLMLKEAALSIVVIQGECAAVETLLEADIVATDIRLALELFLNPKRLIATLRS